MVYLDDILIYGATFEEVMNRFETVLVRLCTAGLKLKPKKCNLFRTEVLFLGYKISCNGIHTDPAKIKSVKEFPVPTDTNGVRKFLGLTNYYRKFVENYAKTAYSLNRLLDQGTSTKKNNQSKPKYTPKVFNWTVDCQKAFDTLKQKLITAPILAMPREKGLFVLDTDSSAEGLGGVLQQEQDGKLVVIAYSSKSLSKQERNYCVSRQELLSVVYHVQHFRCYLWGNEFQVRTDHASLKFLLNFKDATGQLARWISALAEYHLDIIPRPGKQNGNADSLSRIPCGGKKCLCEHACSDPTLPEFYEKPCPLRQLIETEDIRQVTEKSCNNSDENTDNELDCDHFDPENLTCYTIGEEKSKYPFPWTTQSMKEAQESDPVLKHILVFIKEQTKPKWKEISHLNESAKSFLASWNNLEIHNELLYHRNLTNKPDEQRLQLVIPTAYQTKLLENHHNSITAGHLGVNEVYSRVKAKYFWPDMKNHIEL